jgi:hypothetical protein
VDASRIAWGTLSDIHYADFRQGYVLRFASDGGTLFVPDLVAGAEAFMNHARRVRRHESKGSHKHAR